MITQRNLTILLILCTSLVLRGDGCNVLEQKDVEQVAGIPIPAEWVSDGHTEANFTETLDVNIAGDLRDAITENGGADNLQSVGVSGVQYKVLESTGHDARRAGSVTVRPTSSDFPLDLLTFNISGNETGREGAAGDGSGELTMNSAGTTFVAGRLNSWLDQYKANPDDSSYDSLLEFRFVANWTSTPPPTAQDPDNFRWTTDLVVQVVQIITINGD